MEVSAGEILYAASDVVDACACGYLPLLERARADGVPGAPAPSGAGGAGDTPEPLAALRERLAWADLSHRGAGVAIPREAPVAAAAAQTLEAMAAGAEVIRRPVLLQPPWLGRPDFLVRAAGGSGFGAHRYEVVDVGQARSEALVLGAVESLLVGEVQGEPPELQHLWLGTGRLATFPAGDHAAYAALAQRRFLRAAARAPAGAAPDPVPHCARCRFSHHCAALRRAQDHLALLPGLRGRQIAQLRRRGLATVAALAAVDPGRMGGTAVRPALARFAQVARLSLQERASGAPCWQLRPVLPGRGLCRLPEPSPGDVFFALEGDPPIASAPGPRLWGWLAAGGDGPTHGRGWAPAPEDGRAALEAFVDMVAEARARWPGMHAYHHGAAAPAALQRLAGRSGTREGCLDGLLCGEVFVDLRRVVEEALLVSRESYALGDLEPLYLGRARAGAAAGSAVPAGGAWAPDADPPLLCQARARNEEAARSAAALRDWLERLRAQARVAERPAKAEAGAPPPGERDLDHAAARLAGGPPGEDRGRAVLAGLLHWYRGERRPGRWAAAVRRGAAEDALLEDPECLARLMPAGRTDDTWDFRFDRAQEYTLGVGDRPCDAATGRPAGTIVALDPALGRVRLRHVGDLTGLRALGPGPLPGAGRQEAALRRVAEAAAGCGLSGPGPYRHLRELLAGLPPRFLGGAAPLPPVGGGEAQRVAAAAAAALDGSTLAVQGPPGTGKTTIAAAVAAALLRGGRTVGVTAPGHRAIGDLLGAIDRALGPRAGLVRGVQRAPAAAAAELPWVVQTDGVAGVAAQIAGGARLVAGTARLFSRPELDGRLDVLVLDDAGRYPLADAVAAGTAARNLVLLGDPGQGPPVRGAHPAGVGVSVLEHVLAGRSELPPERGLVLPVTHRLHPALASFVADRAYGGRLRAAPGCAARRLEGLPPWSAANLLHVPVAHAGNRQSSGEEAAVVAGIVRDLLRCALRDGGAPVRGLTLEDILVLTPFAAHAQRLAAAVPPGARVGTVERFQGREAAVAIYSTAASDADWEARGLEPLFSLNRLVAAASRAQVLAVLVGSPLLLSGWSDDPARLRFMSALCDFVLRANPRFAPA